MYLHHWLNLRALKLSSSDTNEILLDESGLSMHGNHMDFRLNLALTRLTRP